MIADRDLDLPGPGDVIAALDRHFADEPLPIEAAVEHAFEDADGDVQRYARRRLDEVLGRPPRDEPGHAERAAVDDWINGLVLEWRQRFGEQDERPAR
jgi:hypothetical protein